MPEKIWYFDTVSLCNFFFAGAGHILASRYRNRAKVTWEVYDEICAGIERYPMLREIETLLNKEVFLTASLSEQSRELYTQLISNLGKGEASCIALAKFTKGTVVTDDRAARQTCVDLELSYTGTLGILKACVPDDTILVEKADGLLEQMIGQGFYSPVRRISDILP